MKSYIPGRVRMTFSLFPAQLAKTRGPDSVYHIPEEEVWEGLSISKPCFNVPKGIKATPNSESKFQKGLPVIYGHLQRSGVHG